MANLTKRITIFLSTALLGTTLMGSAAFAAVPHRTWPRSAPPRRTRLVENGVITREQKQRILEAFNCPPPSTDRPAAIDRPSTTRPTAMRTTAAN